jgi:hypothetical protein
MNKKTMEQIKWIEGFKINKERVRIKRIIDKVNKYADINKKRKKEIFKR